MGRLLIRGGQVWDPAGDVHAPALRDVLVDGAHIAAVAPPGDPATAEWLAADTPPEVIDATDRLVIPGFVNTHFHSYDGLMMGLLEDMPFDVWALHSQPPTSAGAVPRKFGPVRWSARSSACSSASPPCRT